MITVLFLLLGSAALSNGFDTICMEFPLVKNLDHYLDKCSAICGFPFVMDAKSWVIADLNASTVAKAKFPPISRLKEEFTRFHNSNKTVRHKADAAIIKKLPENHSLTIALKIYVVGMEESSSDGYHLQRQFLEQFLTSYSTKHNISSLLIIPAGNRPMVFENAAKFLKYMGVVATNANLDLYLMAKGSVKGLKEATVKQIDLRTKGLILATVGLSKKTVTSFDSPLGGKFPETIKSIVKTWVSLGYPHTKLFGSVDFSVQTYNLDKDSTNDGLDVKAKIISKVGYNKYCSKLSSLNWTLHKEAASIFTTEKGHWITMESAHMLEKKVSFMMKQKLKGVAVWGIKGDSSPDRSCPAGKYALINIVHYTIKRQKNKIKLLIKSEGLNKRRIMSKKKN